MMDEHWIAYPEFIAGSLGFFERLKLKLAGRPEVRYLDVILARAETKKQGDVLARAGCAAGSYVLIVPGGGTGHPGAQQAVERFVAAGQALAAGAVPTVYVGPLGSSRHQAGVAGHEKDWHPQGSLPQADLAELMRGARLVVTNGGSTLLQAIACGTACVAVPIAKDQFERTRRCVAAGVAAAAALDTADILQVTERLLQNEPQRGALAERAAALRLADGVEVAIRALDNLLGSAQRAPRH